MAPIKNKPMNNQKKNSSLMILKILGKSTWFLNARFAGCQIHCMEENTMKRHELYNLQKHPFNSNLNSYSEGLEKYMLQPLPFWMGSNRFLDKSPFLAQGKKSLYSSILQ